MLSEMGVVGGEVIILSRDARGSSRAGMEDFSVDSLRGVYTALDHRDASIENIVDVGAGLGVSPLVEVGDGVVVGVHNIILYPILLNDAMGVLFVAITF